MIYPEFLKIGDTVGICAPSAGVGKKLDRYLDSLKVLRSQGYMIRETASVRVLGERSASAVKRAREFDQLISDPRVSLLQCAAGGDYMLEMMPYVNFDHIRKNPKWIAGMSDPTNILFTVTTMLDIATFYGSNASFTSEKFKPQEVYFRFLQGDIVRQHSYSRYVSFIDEINENKVYQPVSWIGSAEELKFKGRLIGGCLESIEKLIGTKYDHVQEFIERYQDDGIIWYFDIFNMSAYNFYLTLLQFKEAGWFSHCNGVLIGRPAFPNTQENDLDYAQAARLALKKIPYILEMDIGHTTPYMIMINGAMADVKYRDLKGSIGFRLK